MEPRHHLYGDMCSPSHSPQQKATCPKPVAHWPLLPRALLVSGIGGVYTPSISLRIFPELQLPEQELAAAGERTPGPGI